MPTHDSQPETPQHTPAEELAGVLPDQLADDLAGLFDARVMVPADRDQAVHAHAQAHLHQIVQRRRLKLFVGGAAGGAIAAAIMMMVMLAGLGTPQTVTPSPSSLAQQPVTPSNQDSQLPGEVGDVDGSGTVDILDALKLARHIEDGDADPAWDVNRDSAVDDRDVDAVARLAVRLSRHEQERGG